MSGFEKIIQMINEIEDIIEITKQNEIIFFLSPKIGAVFQLRR